MGRGFPLISPQSYTQPLFFRFSGYFPWIHGKFICKGERKWSFPGLRSMTIFHYHLRIGEVWTIRNETTYPTHRKYRLSLFSTNYSNCPNVYSIDSFHSLKNGSTDIVRENPWRIIATDKHGPNTDIRTVLVRENLWRITATDRPNSGL